MYIAFHRLKSSFVSSCPKVKKVKVFVAKLHNMEIAQSISRDEFIKLITEQSNNESEIAKTIVDILESQSCNTFSEFLRLEEIDKVCA